jgi:hypothetical protein
VYDWSYVDFEATCVEPDEQLDDGLEYKVTVNGGVPPIQLTVALEDCPDSILLLESER